MTCAICRWYDVCIERNTIRSCTHTDAIRGRDWVFGMCFDPMPNKPKKNGFHS